MDDITFAGWRKPRRSFSNGGCVEAGTWRKSSRSNGTNCLEAAPCPCGVAVRDSKDPGGPVLAFPAAAWRRFTAQAKTPPGAISR